MKIVVDNKNIIDNFTGQRSQGEKSFKDILENTLESANSHQKEYETLLNREILGEDVNLHSITIAGQKAKLSLELTLQIRNKAIEAYQEIMRMQV